MNVQTTDEQIFNNMADWLLDRTKKAAEELGERRGAEPMLRLIETHRAACYPGDDVLRTMALARLTLALLVQAYADEDGYPPEFNAVITD